MIIVTRDNRPRYVAATDADAYRWLQAHQGQSVKWACKYEGWHLATVSDVHVTSTVGTHKRRGAPERVDVELCLADLPATTTTEHETNVAAFRVSITGEISTPQGRRGNTGPFSCGQIRDELTAAYIDTYAEGWTPATVAELRALWDTHHLNDMRAGCAHQTPVMEERYGQQVPSLDLTPPCPLTGYKYGHAWLTDPPRVTGEPAARLLDLFGWTP